MLDGRTQMENDMRDFNTLAAELVVRPLWEFSNTIVFGGIVEERAYNTLVEHVLSPTGRQSEWPLYRAITDSVFALVTAGIRDRWEHTWREK
jgi:hypothetical protein